MWIHSLTFNIFSPHPQPKTLLEFAVATTGLGGLADNTIAITRTVESHIILDCVCKETWANNTGYHSEKIIEMKWSEYGWWMT